MGRIWEMDAVHKNISTSDYGNIVSLTESPLVEGLIFVGTDDGLIQVTEDGGANWRAVERVPGVPERTYVSDLEASLHDADTVYATFDNHKNGDFAPYVAVSRDRGRTWSSIRSDLPDREVAYTLTQDHEEARILFLGTEFALWVTLDEGAHWHRLKGGMPTIQIRDLDIQRQWNDLAAASFGRGFFILDDYTSLRHMSEDRLANEKAILFPTRDALRYMEQSDRVGSRGDGFWTADNPPFGAVFTYWLRDGLKTKSELRTSAEKKARQDGTKTPLPSMAELREEDLELEPAVFIVIRDDERSVVRRVEAERTKGLHRTAWDLRWPSAAPTDLSPAKDLPPWAEPERGPWCSGRFHGNPRATHRRRVGGSGRTGLLRSQGPRAGHADAGRSGRGWRASRARSGSSDAGCSAPRSSPTRSGRDSTTCDRRWRTLRQPIRA
jgi:hypothetical protein